MKSKVRVAIYYDHGTCGAPAIQQDRALAVFSLPMMEIFVGSSCYKRVVPDLSGISALAMTSEIAMRPPSRKHRKHSRNTFKSVCKEMMDIMQQDIQRQCEIPLPLTCVLSGLKLITQFEMTASTEESGTGRYSISPSRNEINSLKPFARADSRAFLSISGVMSIPMTKPEFPTCVMNVSIHAREMLQGKGAA